MERALAEFAAVVGADRVSVEANTLHEAETGTFATSHHVAAIVWPGSTAEVQECVRIANRFGIPLYPFSTGKNWGYGSRIPTADCCVLLDLGRMNRIVDFSEELAYVTLEPGVTQAQLMAFLSERGSRLWMDATGASPYASLVGNAVERGFGHTPYGDHFANCCGMEVVLPTGDVIQTGFARYPGAVSAPTYRWGVGPTLDGLFSQSNFGVVTRLTQWLMPAPEYFQAYYFRTEHPEGLADLVNALRPLRLNGTIRSASHIANDYKVIQALRQYPWELTGRKTPLTEPVLGDLRKQLRIGAWNGSGALYGTRQQVAEARRLVRTALKGKANRLQFMDDRLLALAGRFAKPFEWVSGWDLKRTLAVLGPVYGLMKGVPTDHPLFSTYWRKNSPPPETNMNPDRDGCGLLWCSPVAPTDGVQARRVSELASELILGHGLEPAISITMITERSLACIISLAWDRSVPGEDARAESCYRDLLTQLGAAGYHSYRLSVNGMHAMQGDDSYSTFLHRLKDTLDPNGIMSPGRYITQNK